MASRQGVRKGHQRRTIFNCLNDRLTRLRRVGAVALASRRRATSLAPSRTAQDAPRSPTWRPPRSALLWGAQIDGQAV